MKPTQQVSGSSGQAVLSSTSHQQHSGIVAPSLMGNPLSPPPMQPVIGAGVGIGQPPQQYTTNQHLSYQVRSFGGLKIGWELKICREMEVFRLCLCERCSVCTFV